MSDEQAAAPGVPGPPIHPEGAEITHPAGHRYRRVNGNWVLIEEKKSEEQA